MGGKSFTVPEDKDAAGLRWQVRKASGAEAKGSHLKPKA